MKFDILRIRRPFKSLTASNFFKLTNFLTRPCICPDYLKKEKDGEHGCQIYLSKFFSLENKIKILVFETHS